MQPRWSAVLAVVALGGTPALGAQTEAPLATSRRELQELNTSKGNTLSTEARSDKMLPRLTIPPAETPAGPVNQPPSDAASLKEKSARANWLVNGVLQLEKQEKNQASADARGSRRDLSKAKGDLDEGEKGPDEANTLLEVYALEEQRETAGKRSAASPRPATVDPLAPFLREWMGNSPAQGEFFDKFARGDRLGASATPAGDSSLSVSVVETRDSADFLISKPDLANPYLPVGDAPDLSALRRVSSAGSNETELNRTRANDHPASLPFFPAAVSGFESLPPPKKNPPAPMADDKKHFPQLKKF